MAHRTVHSVGRGRLKVRWWLPIYRIQFLTGCLGQAVCAGNVLTWTPSTHKPTKLAASFPTRISATVWCGCMPRFEVSSAEETAQRRAGIDAQPETWMLSARSLK